MGATALPTRERRGANRQYIRELRILPSLEPLVVHGETFDDIFVETLRSPLAKASTNDGMNTITYRNDDVKVITKDLMNLSFPLYGAVWSGCSEFPNNH